MARRVTVYNTIGGNLTHLETNSTTWGELQRELDSRGIVHNGMSAVEGATQVTYESPVATLPTGDFQLFLAPKKVKSGGDDSYLIDFDGISWDDEDWDSDSANPEDFTFKTTKDLAIARAKRAQHYLEEVVEYLLANDVKKATDPEILSLQKTAEDIKRNLGLYD